MLKGISPLIPPELLKNMAEMGHDDALLVADANFTAVKLAGNKPVIRVPGINLLQMIDAIVEIFPLVSDEIYPIAYMRVERQPETYQSELQRKVIARLQPLMLESQKAEAIERFAFYERTKSVFAIVVTGELQPYGNFILRKGVIADQLRA